MAILPIIEAPHPVLSKKARAVEPNEFGPSLARLLDDMAETMYAAPGVGLAAPQIGDSRRILVADPGYESEQDAETRGVHLVHMINPVILETSGTVTWEESCLSVPDFEVKVKRHQEIKVRFQDAQGAVHEKAYDGFPAVVVQHEMDHLLGVTLLEHASRFKKSRYVSKVKKARGRARA